MNLMRHLYNKAWRHDYDRTQPNPNSKDHVRTYGFKTGQCTDDVVSLIRQLLKMDERWPDRPVIIAALDIKTAFDDILHHLIYEANQAQQSSKNIRREVPSKAM